MSSAGPPNKRLRQTCLSFASSGPIKRSGLDKLKSVVAGHGYTVHNVPMDGDCALHAIIDQLHCLDGPTDADVAYTTVGLRYEAINRLSFCESQLSAFLDVSKFHDMNDYVMKMKHGEWCDEIMLRSIAEVLNKAIHVIHDNGHETYINPNSNISNCDNVIHLGLIGELHYVSLHKCDDTAPTTVLTHANLAIETVSTTEVPKPFRQTKSADKRQGITEMYRGIKLSDARKFSWLRDAGVDKCGKKCVICVLCAEFSSTSKLLATNHHVPPIATGCRYSAKVVIDHSLSSAHRAAEDAAQCAKMYKKDATQHLWLAAIAKMDRELYKKLVVFAFDVYNDAQTGTLSAWSWPARHLARSASAAFLSSDSTTDFTPFTPSFSDIQYLNPCMHRELLHCIADVGREDLAVELKTALAVSLSYDGSVDAYQEDSKYLGVRYVTRDGVVKAKFLGTDAPTERGAEAAAGAISKVLDKSMWPFSEATNVITGFTTDGESLNTGSKNGLWVKLRQLCAKNVMCIWCACHRSSLAYKSLFIEVAEVRTLLQDCRSVATFFRTSGIRTLELNKVCDDMNLKTLHFPEFKEVRMTEFTCALLEVMIRNLPGCLKYWQQRAADTSENTTDRKQMSGFLRTWTNVDKLKLLHVLFDASHIVERLQKRLQFTLATLEDVPVVKTWAVTCLKGLLEAPVSGGQEEAFLSSLHVERDSQREDDESVQSLTWNGFQLQQPKRRTKQANLYVSDTCRSYDAVRQEIGLSLINFIESRLETTELMELIPVLFNFESLRSSCQSSASDFVEVYGKTELSTLCKEYMPDLDMSCLASEFILLKAHVRSKLSAGQIENGNQNSLLTMALKLNLPVFAEAAARIMSLFPHSMYVERLVSSHNLIKSETRASMDRETLNDYLMVKESMGPLAAYDARRTIAKWMSLKQRRPKTNDSQQKVQKYMSQEYVKNVFSP